MDNPQPPLPENHTHLGKSDSQTGNQGNDATDHTLDHSNVLETPIEPEHWDDYDCAWGNDCGASRRDPEEYRRLVLRKYIKNIEEHVQLVSATAADKCLVCEIDGKKFSRWSDLVRHRGQVHPDLYPPDVVFPCPVTSCPRHLSPFTRRDKCSDHVRKLHRNLDTTIVRRTCRDANNDITACKIGRRGGTIGAGLRSQLVAVGNEVDTSLVRIIYILYLVKVESYIALT